MDTNDWTVDDHIAWIRDYAENARTMAKMVLGWQLDVLGTYAGTVEVVPWPEDPMPMRRLRRAADKEIAEPTGTRVIHAGGYSYLVRDVVKGA